MKGEDAIEMRESLTGVLERGEERRGGGEETSFEDIRITLYVKRREKRTWRKTGAKKDIGIKIKTLGGREERKVEVEREQRGGRRGQTRNEFFQER